MDEGKFTGLKYDEDCGFYAVHDGLIVSPKSGISGDKGDALSALFNSTHATYRSSAGNDYATITTRKSAFNTFRVTRELLESHEKEMAEIHLAEHLAALWEEDK